MNTHTETDQNTVLLNLGNFSETFEFTIADGFTSDVSFNIGVSGLVGLLPNAFAKLEVNINGTWQEVGDSSTGGLLELLGLANTGVVVNANDLLSGEYRLTYSGGGLLGALTSINLVATMHDTSLHDFTGTGGPAVTGSLFDGSDSSGQPDVRGPGGSAALYIDIDGTGNFVQVSNGTVVNGQYGVLTVNANGSFSYKPNDNAAAVGKVDDFAYKLVHPTAGEDSAHLYVQIGSPQADVQWNAGDPSAPGTLTTDAGNDQGAAGIELVPQVTSVVADNAIQYSSLLFLGGSDDYLFSLGANSSTDVTVDLTSTGLVNLLSSMNFTLYRDSGGGNWVEIASSSDENLIDVIGIGSNAIQATIEDLTTGSYKLTVSNGGLGLVTTITADVTLETTHPNQLVAGDVFPAHGNVLTNDTPGSQYTVLEVHNDAYRSGSP